MTHGIQVELCGATAKVHHWGNADLLPGVKVSALGADDTLQFRHELSRPH
jgi:intracellular sulfur oxidation DsrE/DsrF family protein